MLTRARLWLRSVVLRRRLEREMQEEMAAHLERAAERLMARGLSADEARRQARREFGNVAFLQEQARDARGARWLEALGVDARFALRHFARTPGTTLVMFAVLAVGISISALLFSAVHSVALQPPSGVARSDDLVRIRGLQDSDASRPFAADEFLAYRALGDHFRAVAGWTWARLPVLLHGDTERRGVAARVVFVTEDYFSVLGLRPVIGSGLSTAGSDNPASAAVAVIGYPAWEHHFGSDRGVVGSTVTVGGMPVTVVGVAPERFYGISDPYHRIQLWMPLAARRHLALGPSPRLSAVARLRPGVALQSASAAVQVVADRFAASNDTLRALRSSADVVPLLAMNENPIFERGVRVMASP